MEEAHHSTAIQFTLACNYLQSSVSYPINDSAALTQLHYIGLPFFTTTTYGFQTKRSSYIIMLLSVERTASKWKQQCICFAI